MKTCYFLPIVLFAANFSFGAELFVKVNSPGNFRAAIGGQMQSNYTNTFRFFDLPAGYEQIQVVNQNNNMTFFTGSLSLAQNERLIADIDQFGNFRVVQREYIQNTGWNNPYNYGNNPYAQTGSYGNNGYYNTPNGNYQNNGYNNLNNNQYFQQFMQLMHNESFDSNKLTMAKDYASKTQLSASQIAAVAKEFSFDSRLLDWAKSAYANCCDKQNYFLMKNIFTFSSSYNDLVQYTSVH